MVLSQVEKDLLARLQEDGFPLVILAPGTDLTGLQQTALALLRKGLIGVYGRPDDAHDLSVVEAEAVLSSVDNWTEPPDGQIWFISTTSEGDAILSSLG
jgi:hypothetical protein